MSEIATVKCFVVCDQFFSTCMFNSKLWNNVNFFPWLTSTLQIVKIGATLEICVAFLLLFLLSGDKEVCFSCSDSQG